MLQEIIDNSSKIVFFGGAGVSTESGIPDFRSVDGIYNSEWDLPPEQIISKSFFKSNPSEFYRFYRKKMIYPNALPNAAHYKLAELEEKGKLIGVITQNIDGLHQKAGSKNVYELHGSIHRNYCTQCGAFYDLNTIIESENEVDKLPHCKKCGGLIKPDVLLYEESFTGSMYENWTKAIDALKRSDTLIIGGTSLTVYPAADLIKYFRGKNIVVINKIPLEMERIANCVIHDSIGKVFSEIKC